MDWADYDASERGVFLQRLLLNVRFPYIDTDVSIFHLQTKNLNTTNFFRSLEK